MLIFLFVVSTDFSPKGLFLHFIYNFNFRLHIVFSMCVQFPGSSVSKAAACSARALGLILIGKILWRRRQQTTPVTSPGNSHGQRSLVGYSPWGHKELGTTEQLTFHLSQYRWIQETVPRRWFCICFCQEPQGYPQDQIYIKSL